MKFNRTYRQLLIDRKIFYAAYQYTPGNRAIDQEIRENAYKKYLDTQEKIDHLRSKKKLKQQKDKKKLVFSW